MKNKLSLSITPLNEKLFGDDNYCLWNDLLSAISQHYKNIDYLIANACISLSLSNNKVEAKPLFINSLEDVLKKYGIESFNVRGLFGKKKILNFIKSCIENNTFVVALQFNAKSFDLENSKIKSEKDYTFHYILIHGFNDEKKEFHIIDHLTLTALIYKNCLVKYNDFFASLIKGKFFFHTKQVLYTIPFKNEMTLTNKESIVQIAKKNLSVFIKEFNTNQETILIYLKDLNYREITYNDIFSIGTMIDYFSFIKRFLTIIKHNYDDMNIIRNFKLLRVCAFKALYDAKEFDSSLFKSQISLCINSSELILKLVLTAGGLK